MTKTSKKFTSFKIDLKVCLSLRKVRGNSKVEPFTGFRISDWLWPPGWWSMINSYFLVSFNQNQKPTVESPEQSKEKDQWIVNEWFIETLVFLGPPECQLSFGVYFKIHWCLHILLRWGPIHLLTSTTV